jgi:hypothetical protein
MTLPRTVADVLSGHVTFEVECVDRMYLSVCVPQLQYATGLVSYIHRRLGKPVASAAALAPVSEAFTRSVRSFAASCGIPWADFARGQRKDDVALEFLAGFTGTEGVLFIGRAQEKVPLFRTRKRRRADGSSCPWIAAETGVVELPRVFRTGKLRLIHAASCPFRYSSKTSCGVRYPSVEWRRVLL